MLKSSRKIASLIGSVVLGATPGATATLTLTSAASVVALSGCKDESQPEYWVDKLDDAAWRARAVKRLEQFFEDAITKANKDYDNAEVQALLNKIVEPLSKTYIENYDQFDTKTRVSLIKLLASFRDKRTEPALKKAFEEFAKKPTGSKDEQDIKWAARAAGELKLAGVADPMLQAFQKLKASSQLGGVTYRDMNEAMVQIAAKSWAGPLKTMLEPEMEMPKDNKARDKIEDFQNQQFWQTTAAQLLGEIEDETAVEPLMKVMLEPQKANVQATALLALVKIGKPAMNAAIKLLKGEDQKLTTFALARMQKATGAKEPPKDKPEVRTAALIIGTIGRPEGMEPMIAALKAADKDINKAVIARELTKLPATPEAKAAFKEAYESISIETVIPPGANALQMLTEAAGQFYDPDMVDWLLVRAEATKGSGEDKKALQSAITITVLKLAKAEQLDPSKKAVDAYGTKLEKDIYAQVEKLLKACGDRVSCYLEAIEKGENQDQKTQFVGIKAGYMIAIYGNEQTRDELIGRLDAVENAAVRFTAAQAIDKLSPKGSADAADKLDKLIKKNEESANRDKIAGDAPLKQVMYRLRTRAR